MREVERREENPAQVTALGGLIEPAQAGPFRKFSTEELIHSLRPGESGALKVRPDGTPIMDGHHRLCVPLNSPGTLPPLHLSWPHPSPYVRPGAASAVKGGRICAMKWRSS